MADDHVAEFRSFPWFQGTTRFVGVCSCGWRGGKTADQAEARRAAVNHASARNGSPDLPAKQGPVVVDHGR